MRILITGAAGYIGSVVTELLLDRENEVIAVDSLQNGHRSAIDSRAVFVQGDLTDPACAKRLLAAKHIDAVVHLAAEALIDESVRDPGRFFKANVLGGLNLLEAMAANGVKNIVFSSSAALYGEPSQIPIQEDAPLAPVNSYGESKLMFEHLLPWYRRAYGLRHVSLRYFNACGATECHGEFHIPETHLVPLACAAALGSRDSISLYGTDYDTEDGTCIRDYVHVEDIALAHFLALRQLEGVEARAYNIGNGIGYSNREVIEMVSVVTGKEIPVVAAPRRPGDPARLVASPVLIQEELGWQPRFPDLKDMVQSQWLWLQRHPNGYDD